MVKDAHANLAPNENDFNHSDIEEGNNEINELNFNGNKLQPRGSLMRDEDDDNENLLVNKYIGMSPA